MKLKNFIKSKKKNLKINLEKIEQLKIDTLSEIKRIKKNVDEELRIISLRKQNTFFDKNSKQVEEKIKDELKKEILSKTIFFTEYRIKKSLKKLIIQSLCRNLSKNCPKMSLSLWLFTLSYQKLK